MRTRSLDLALLLVIAFPIFSSVQTTDAVQALRDRLLRITQHLLNALPTGDKAPWERSVADDAIIADEFGCITSKAEAIASLHPFPKGFFGSIE